MTSKPTERTRHWNAVYGARPPTAVSWYRPHLERSLSFILSGPAGKEARLIDVGGGASTLIDDLLDVGFRHLTVLDVSDIAMQRAKERLGSRADQVAWIVGDVIEVPLPRAAYDVWHDRAVFHFLTAKEERGKYVSQVRRALRPAGQVIMAAFSLNGPPRCSGLDVVRYRPETLLEEFGEPFTLLEQAVESHATPSGTTQEFLYCRMALNDEHRRAAR